MPPSQHEKATLGEKLGVVWSIGVTALKGIFVLVRYPLITDPWAQPTLGKEIIRVVTRELTARLNHAQLQWISTPSTVAYKSWISSKAKKEGVPAEVVTEPIGDEGGKLHWIGNPDAKKVLLHFHSGGFVMPLNEGHINLINYIRSEIKRRSGVDVKAAFLEYTLAPMTTHPVQLRQAVLALQQILKSGISPADILISGDSAGGSLAIQIISHHLHPHASVPPLSMPPVPFAGILVISPWVAFDSDAPSFVHNEGDSVSIILLRGWGKLSKDRIVPSNKDVPEEYWSEPRDAPPNWWNGSEKVINHIMVAYGERECLRDDILSFVEKFREGVAGHQVDIVTASDPVGIHIGSTIQMLLEQGPDDLAVAMSRWAHDRLVT